MILGGAVAGQGAINLYILIAIAWSAALAGDTHQLLRRPPARPRVPLAQRAALRRRATSGFEQIDDYFDRHGGKTIFIGRFVGFVRALAPFIAGSSGMRYRAFVPYSVLGTGLWVSAPIVLGYLFSRSIDSVRQYAGKGAFVLGDAHRRSIVGFITLGRYLRVEENRREPRCAGWRTTRRPAGSSSLAGASARSFSSSGIG